MKQVLKSILFVVIFFILLFFTTKIFVLKGNTYGSDVISFYNTEKNSLDIMFFGSSHSYATFSPDVIEEKTGYKSYNFATQQQPVNITYHYMVEALKYQHPKYFVVDIKMFAVNDEYASEGVVRDALDKMKFSINKIKAISSSVEDKKDWLSYYFNILKYHSRYQKLGIKTDIVNGLLNIGINNKGFKSLDSNEEIMIDNSNYLNEDESLEITKKNKLYLFKMMDLVKDNNIKLIFVKSPCQLSNNEQLYYNYVFELAEKNGFDYIDYNMLIDDLNLEYGDFYDGGHLSYKGAEKVSKHFSSYIKVMENGD